MLRSLAVIEYPIGGGFEVVDHDGAGEFGSLLGFDLCAVAGAHEQRALQSAVPAAGQINELVADHIAPPKIYSKFIARVEEKFRGRFAAPAGLVRRFGRDVDFLEMDAGAFQFFDKVPVHVLNIRQAEISAADAGLVGDNK